MLAGMDWLYGFLKWNSSITVRQTKATSINRVATLHKKTITLFFKNIEDIMQRNLLLE